MAEFAKDIGDISVSGGPVSAPPSATSFGLGILNQGLGILKNQLEPKKKTEAQYKTEALQPAVERLNAIYQTYEQTGDSSRLRTETSVLMRDFAAASPLLVGELQSIAEANFGYNIGEEEARQRAIADSMSPDVQLENWMLSNAEKPSVQLAMASVAVKYADASPEERYAAIQDVISTEMSTQQKMQGLAEINDPAILNPKLDILGNTMIPSMMDNLIGAAMDPKVTQDLAASGQGYIAFQQVQEVFNEGKRAFLANAAEAGLNLSEEQKKRMFAPMETKIAAFGEVVGTDQGKSLGKLSTQARAAVSGYLTSKNNRVPTPEEVKSFSEELSMLYFAGGAGNEEFNNWLANNNDPSDDDIFKSVSSIRALVSDPTTAYQDIEGMLDIFADASMNKDVDPSKAFLLANAMYDSFAFQLSGDAVNNRRISESLAIASSDLKVSAVTVGGDVADSASTAAVFDSEDMNYIMSQPRDAASSGVAEAQVRMGKRIADYRNGHISSIRKAIGDSTEYGVSPDPEVNRFGQLVLPFEAGSDAAKLVAEYNRQNPGANLSYDSSAVPALLAWKNDFRSGSVGERTDQDIAFKSTQSILKQVMDAQESLRALSTLDHSIRRWSKTNESIGGLLSPVTPAIANPGRQLESPESSVAPAVDNTEGPKAMMQAPDGTPVGPARLVNRNSENPAFVEEVPSTPQTLEESTFMGIEGEFINYIPDEVAGNKEFVDKLGALSAELGVPVDNLAAIIAFETGNSWDPAQKNKAGGSATGLIQFMPETALGLGTTTEELAEMTPEEQMDYVRAYFKQHEGKLKRSEGTIADLYMAVLWPRAIGKPDDYVLWRKRKDGKKGPYEWNDGLDKEGKGYITKGDAAKKVVANWERVKKSRSA